MGAEEGEKVRFNGGGGVALERGEGRDEIDAAKAQDTASAPSPKPTLRSKLRAHPT